MTCLRRLSTSFKAGEDKGGAGRRSHYRLGSEGEVRPVGGLQEGALPPLSLSSLLPSHRLLVALPLLSFPNTPYLLQWPPPPSPPPPRTWLPTPPSTPRRTLPLPARTSSAPSPESFVSPVLAPPSPFLQPRVVQLAHHPAPRPTDRLVKRVHLLQPPPRLIFIPSVPIPRRTCCALRPCRELL